MNPRLFTAFAAALLFSGFGLVQAEDSGFIMPAYRKIYPQWQELVKNESSNLTDMTLHENDTISINAFWLSAIRGSYDREKGSIKLADTTTASFMGFIEGRLRIKPPRWWADIISQHYRPSANWGNGSPATAHGNPPEYTLSVSDAKLRVVSNANTIQLEAPNSILKMTKLFGVQGTAIAVNGSHLFVARFSSLPVEYPIDCFDLQSGKLLWESAIWAGAADPSGGSNHHAVQLQVRNDKVVALGAGTECYIQVLNAVDGKTLAWWTTQLGTYYSRDHRAQDN